MDETIILSFNNTVNYASDSENYIVWSAYTETIILSFNNTVNYASDSENYIVWSAYTA